MSVLHELVTVGNDIKRLRELLSAGEDPNVLDDRGNTPLNIIASKKLINPQDTENSLKMAVELIAFKADVENANFENNTPLMHAVRARNCRMVEYLLEAKANINHRDSRGFTALHYTVVVFPDPSREKGHKTPELQIVETLLRFQPNIDAKSLMGLTPLMMAVEGQDLPIVRCLLKHKASVNVLDRQKASVLHRALYHAVNMNIVFELLRYGVDFGIRNKYDQTPMDIYIDRLKESSREEVENRTCLFKIFILLKNSLSASQQQDIEKITREKDCNLSVFITHCMDETNKMLGDELASNYNVHDMALRGFLNGAEKDNISHDVYDKVIDKTINCEYPMYYDLIISGIYIPYLKNKFAEICCLVESPAVEFLKFDVRFKLSCYLSPIEMFNMMLACSAVAKWNQPSPYLVHGQPYIKSSVM